MSHEKSHQMRDFAFKAFSKSDEMPDFTSVLQGGGCSMVLLVCAFRVYGCTGLLLH